MLDREGVLVHPGRFHREQPPPVLLRSVQPDGQADPVIGGHGGGPALQILPDPAGQLRIRHKGPAVQPRQHRLGDLGAGAGMRWGRGGDEPGGAGPTDGVHHGGQYRPAHGIGLGGRLQDGHRGRHAGHQVVQPLSRQQGRDPTHPVASGSLTPAAATRGGAAQDRDHAALGDQLGTPERDLAHPAEAGTDALAGLAGAHADQPAQDLGQRCGARLRRSLAGNRDRNRRMALPCDAAGVSLVEQPFEVLGRGVGAGAARPHDHTTLRPRSLQERRARVGRRTLTGTDRGRARIGAIIASRRGRRPGAVGGWQDRGVDLVAGQAQQGGGQAGPFLGEVRHDQLAQLAGQAVGTLDSVVGLMNQPAQARSPRQRISVKLRALRARRPAASFGDYRCFKSKPVQLCLLSSRVVAHTSACQACGRLFAAHLRSQSPPKGPGPIGSFHLNVLGFPSIPGSPVLRHPYTRELASAGIHLARPSLPQASIVARTAGPGRYSRGAMLDCDPR